MTSIIVKEGYSLAFTYLTVNRAPSILTDQIFITEYQSQNCNLTTETPRHMNIKLDSCLKSFENETTKYRWFRLTQYLPPGMLSLFPKKIIKTHAYKGLFLLVKIFFVINQSLDFLYLFCIDYMTNQSDSNPPQNLSLHYYTSSSCSSRPIHDLTFFKFPNDQRCHRLSQNCMFKLIRSKISLYI